MVGALVPGRNSEGLFTTTLLGTGGAFFGTYLGKALGWYNPGEAAGFIGSVVGAMLIFTNCKYLVPDASSRQ